MKYLGIAKTKTGNCIVLEEKMMRHRNIIGILLISLLAVSLIFAEEQRPDLKSLVTGNNAFALDLYSILKKEKGNLFLSPYSISSALAMTYGGARGDTAEEMAKALHLPIISRIKVISNLDISEHRLPQAVGVAPLDRRTGRGTRVLLQR